MTTVFGLLALLLAFGVRPGPWLLLVQGLVLARTRDAPAIELSINLTTNARDCSGAPGLFYSARLTLNGNRMTGTYEPSIGCPLLRGGSLELIRR